MAENPFTPSFGEIPAHLAGRRQIIADMTRALSSERRRPELTTIFSGARGMGKTTLLACLANKAEANGWISVSTTALPGMLDDVEIVLRKKAVHLLEPQPGKTLSGFEVAGVGLSFDQAEKPRDNWRSRMTDLLDELAPTGAGVLITVDELDPTLDEMVELAAVYQHFIRENRKVALLMAGLPHNVSALLNNKTVSFLRRAQQVQLGRVDDFEVEEALARTIREAGREVSREGLGYATEHIGGFPFLIQLVGYRAWDVEPDAPQVSEADLEEGVRLARLEMESRILRATFSELSESDVKFVRAMLADEKFSKVSDLAERLEWSQSQVSQYRRRLIDAGVVCPRGRGVVEFEMPYFREFLEGEEA